MVLSVMLLAAAAVFAAQEMSVTWEWLLDDPEVNYHRYQLDGMDENNWTVVPGDVSVYVAEGLDPYKSYTLYLQRSYDGVNWSETAEATAEALLETAELTPVADEPVVVEEPVVEEVAVVEPVEEVVVAEPVDVKKPSESRFTFSMLLSGGVLTPVDYNNQFDPDWNVSAGLAFDFANIITANDNIGFGLRLNLAGDFYASYGTFFDDGFTGFFKDLVNFDNYTYGASASMLLTTDARVGIVDFTLGLGGGYGIVTDSAIAGSVYNQKIKIGENYIYGNWFGEALLGMRFYCGNVFSIGLEGTYRVMIPEYKNNRVDGRIVLGFSF